MASGFTGGGAPDFFTGRSTNQAPQPSYRSNLPGLFHDPSIQIARHQQQLLQQQPQQPHTLIGKRTLSDYQAHQFQNQGGLNGFFYRSVKPLSPPWFYIWWRCKNHTANISNNFWKKNYFSNNFLENYLIFLCLVTILK